MSDQTDDVLFVQNTGVFVQLIGVCEHCRGEVLKNLQSSDAVCNKCGAKSSNPMPIISMVR